MATEPATESEQLGRAEERAGDRERESADRIARMHRALAAAQDRYYWLDRWGIDLNALMRKRGASEARTVLSGIRSVGRIARELREREGRSRAGRPPRLGAEAGPTYYSDLVIDVLGETGARLGDATGVLALGESADDLGRLLTAACPGIDLSAEPAPEQARLPHPDESFEVICAVTPWSGFSESSADAWLRELRRVARPGGRMLLAAQDGFPEPDWLLARTSPDWAVVLYRPRRVLGDRDLYALEPR